MLLLRQIGALALKDLLLLWNRNRINSTIFRSFTTPIILSLYLSVILKLYWPQENYGFSDAREVRSLRDAMDAAKGGRNKIVFINSGPSGGDIDRAIEIATTPLQDSGKTVKVFDDPDELLVECKSTLRGTTPCFAAAIFYSSETEGDSGYWNYTIRADGALGGNIDVDKSDNDAQVYVLPLQHAIDSAIVSISGEESLPDDVQEYPWTSETQDEWKKSITTDVQAANYNFLSIVWYIGYIGLAYQLVGFTARERECGMAVLLESMMPNPRRYEPQVARLVGRFLAFTFTYFPSWVLMMVIAKGGIFPETSAGILIIHSILAGLALNSFSLFCGAFYRKAQLSGITTAILIIIMGIIAQVCSKWMSSAVVGVLGFLFTPMNFVFSFIFMARYENRQRPVNLLEGAPNNHWSLPGIAFWIFYIVQIFAYPILAALVEQMLYGTTSDRREVLWQGSHMGSPVELDGFTKEYPQNWFLRWVAPLFGWEHHPVLAVDNLSLSATRGEINVLIGANGCGKSTTLNAIAGLSTITKGSMRVDGTGGIGLCPQQNVLWDNITVQEHVKIFNRIKAPGQTATAAEIDAMLAGCGLSQKKKAYAKTLSGGQKRKLQLLMMLTGGSSVCCVDEVSGGLDPLSRRKVWDILLAERGRRTIILTTHFLDEAEFLADHMIIMANGKLQAEGSMSELKNKLGGGYRFHVFHGPEGNAVPDIPNASKEVNFDETIYTVQGTAEAMRVIRQLEAEGVENYHLSGPTVEEVFMKLAGDPDDGQLLPSRSEAESAMDGVFQKSSHGGNTTEKSSTIAVREGKDQQLSSGHGTSSITQAWYLLKKRWVILQRNWVPYAAVVLVPIIAAGLISILVDDYKNAGCSYRDQVSAADFEELDDDQTFNLVAGPVNALSTENLALFNDITEDDQIDLGNSSLLDMVHLVNSHEEFDNYIEANRKNVTPGGIYLGDDDSSPMFAYRSNAGVASIFTGVFLQNALDVLVSGVRIATQYAIFDFPWPEDTEDVLQFIFYFGLVMCAYPAFFALYPTIERIRKIRALEYSNGVRSWPLWLAYLVFDWTFVVVLSAVVCVILAATAPDAWWNFGYIFLVLILYGMASILLSYAVSLVSNSQLAAFAFCAGGQAFMLLMYMTAYTNINAQSDAALIDDQLLIAHYTIALVSPISNLLRAFFVSLNLFSILCSGSPPHIASYAGSIKLYGGPIVYLIGQSLFLFGLLVWADHGFASTFFRRSRAAPDPEATDTYEKEVSDETARVTHSTTDGLRVLHLNKTYRSRAYGKVRAVSDLSFGVRKGEVFALLGSNGAGKSTTISLLRGEVRPSRRGGAVFIDEVPLLEARKTARARLGVCPQFDAIDAMTVAEHLRFYAGVRGVADIERNVSRLIAAVGLRPFANRLGSELSGGNKRKLSLAIALVGDPPVLLLDEPSSGMDPLAKRTMWRALSAFVPGRSVLLTTHSMEEADALAGRVGVMAGSMLDVGATGHLRRKHGRGFHVHVVLASAPGTTDEEAARVREWVFKRYPGAMEEGRHYHGQMRFNVPSGRGVEEKVGGEDDVELGESSNGVPAKGKATIGSLFTSFEENKADLGIAHFTVSPTTFDEVFLAIVSKHGVGEEDTPTRKVNWRKYLLCGFGGRR
ncbi:putative ABC transporter [Lineolata rhizophorae]|uniref:Putative ABC transporter n=1 Tax=Lineolata rhizophorae TaxID=578093 RepID=A0A6A6P4I3_9PEZI|nr:putative ABC transporter [Lineolata rhizophorae]